jgi:integrase/recombinase XerC
MSEQEYQDYKSKYLMLYSRQKTDREVVSVLNDVDFCIELMESDRINVAYIMNLIRNIHFDDPKQKDYDIKHIKGAKIDKEHKKDYLTGAQVKNVLSCVDCGATQGLRDYAIIVLMITGGLRTVEVTRANIGDIHNIGESTVLFIQGKGKIEKNDYVKLPDAVEKAIRAYLSSRKDDKSDTSPLFVSGSNNNNGKRLSSRSVSGIVKEYLIKAGYDTPRLTAHSMRHTAVTLSLLAGKDITEVQQFARHESINTTMIYNHALDKEKNGCSEAISSSIF